MQGGPFFTLRIVGLMGVDPSAIVVGVHIKLTAKAKNLTHPRIRLIEGSSTEDETVAQVQKVLPAQTGFVSLDLDHTCEHVLRELEIYNRFVAVGKYLVVEDTNINGHPVFPSFGPGPFEAVDTFLKQNPNFRKHDELWERNLISFHRNGWLQRVR